MILSSSFRQSIIKPQEEETYRALLRNLRRHRGFGILFVHCTPEQDHRIIQQIETDLTAKKLLLSP